ncbi:MAG: dockerin type I domain-containing protein, partial [Patescibacteria group bacterium]
SPTPTGGAEGNVKLNLKLKFQGINKKPPTEELNFIKGKIEGMIIGTNEGFTSTTEGNFLVKSDDNGVWSGTVGIYLPQSALGKKFTLYIKGRRHIQKKICDSVPTETSPGTYRCSTGNITLVAGDNNLDFSGILLLVGDLDQSGIVDSVDFSLVRNCLGKSDTVCVSSSDLNLDGIVNTQDFSMILVALGIRTDEL